jgi:hypothetical protein
MSFAYWLSGPRTGLIKSIVCTMGYFFLAEVSPETSAPVPGRDFVNLDSTVIYRQNLVLDQISYNLIGKYIAG